jgi:regulatory protein
MAHSGQKNSVQQFDKAQAWEKIKHFCRYQERCHSEVSERLFSYGMDAAESGQIISRLIEESYLNEERFAIQYAGGHFRIKKWGKVKIAYALKQKQVSAYCIKKALALIDADDYFTTADKLANEKLRTLKAGKTSEKHYKCRQFLLQRGFEGTLIDQVLKTRLFDK